MARGQGRKRGQIRRQRQSVDNEVESTRRCIRKFTKGIPIRNLTKGFKAPQHTRSRKSHTHEQGTHEPHDRLWEFALLAFAFSAFINITNWYKY